MAIRLQILTLSNGCILLTIGSIYQPRSQGPKDPGKEVVYLRQAWGFYETWSALYDPVDQ